MAITLPAGTKLSKEADRVVAATLPYSEDILVISGVDIKTSTLSGLAAARWRKTLEPELVVVTQELKDFVNKNYR